MPLHRQRTAPKKINRTSGFVSLNHNKIPSVFVSLVAIVLVAGGTIWLINSNISTKPAPQVAAVLEKKNGSIDIDPNNAKVEQQIADMQKQDEPVADPVIETPVVEPIEETPKPTLIRIPASATETENINITELNCSLTFSKTPPSEIKPVVASSSYWIPNTNCKNEDLDLVQIISSNTKPTYENVQIESLDQDTEYAVFYWKKPDFTQNINLDKYLVPLTRFLSNGKLYFNVKDAYDKLQLNNKDTYYLSGNCDGNGTGACILWGLPANGSLVSLLTEKGLANTATGQSNNLTKGQYLKFAKTQDRNNRLALVLKKTADKIDLIYIDPSKSYAIDEVRTYDKDTTGYTKYFR
jgi:hypothetical protein